jgi:hypothetical protein
VRAQVGQVKGILSAISKVCSSDDVQFWNRGVAYNIAGVGRGSLGAGAATTPLQSNSPRLKAKTKLDIICILSAELRL